MVASGDTVCFTDSLELVAALTSLGIQLVDGDDKFFYTLRSGKLRCLWLMKDKSDCGTYNTAEMIKNYGNPKFFENFPHHPLTHAVHAIRNQATYRRWLEHSIPYATFALGDGKELHAKVGSADYEEAIASGLKPL